MLIIYYYNIIIFQDLYNIDNKINVDEFIIRISLFFKTHYLNYYISFIINITFMFSNFYGSF